VRLERRGPFLLVFALSQLTDRLLRTHLASSGLSPGDYAAYSLLLFEGQVTPSRMAEVLGMPATTVSYVIGQMQSRGHLHRLPNPKDGRSSLLELTAAGRRITQHAARGFSSALESFSAELDIPEARLLSVLEGMAAAIEAAAEHSESVAAAG
jgi:DNA-binding MarR family transcriptional regulator